MALVRIDKYRAIRKRRGFTLMEMIIAIAILAIIAVVSWRSLDGIIRGQHAVADSMAETRSLDRLFAQLSYDLAEAVPDAQLGAGAIQFDGAQLHIVRALREPGRPTRWQVVGYRTADGILWRSISAPVASREAARAALEAPPSERQALVEHAVGLEVRGWIDPSGNLGNSANAISAGWAVRDGGVRPPPVMAGASPILPLNRVTGVEVVVLTGAPPTAYRRVLAPTP